MMVWNWMTFFNRLHFLRACFYSNLTKLLRNEHRDKQGETPRFEQDEHAVELFCMPTSLPGLPPCFVIACAMEGGCESKTVS